MPRLGAIDRSFASRKRRATGRRGRSPMSPRDGPRARTTAGSRARRESLPAPRLDRSAAGSDCRMSAGANEPGEHLADLDRRDPVRHRGVALGEGAELVLVLGLDDAETPGAGAVEHRPE